MIRGGVSLRAAIRIRVKVTIRVYVSIRVRRGGEMRGENKARYRLGMGKCR